MLFLFSKSDLFEYPFRAAVWGTFSDWMMVIVTAITAIYLIKTFRSQKKVQELQLKATKIENEKYRLARIPKFKIETITKPATPDEFGSHTQHLVLKLTLMDSSVTSVTVRLTSKNSTVLPDDKNVISARNIDQGSINELNYYLKILSNEYLHGGINTDLNIEYTDPVGNEYNQYAEITIRDGITHISADDVPTYKYD